jgi:hypothetical protein
MNLMLTVLSNRNHTAPVRRREISIEGKLSVAHLSSPDRSGGRRETFH